MAYHCGFLTVILFKNVSNTEEFQKFLQDHHPEPGLSYKTWMNQHKKKSRELQDRFSYINDSSNSERERFLDTFSLEKFCQLQQSAKVNHTFICCKQCLADFDLKAALLLKRSNKLPAPQTDTTVPGTASVSRNQPKTPGQRKRKSAEVTPGPSKSKDAVALQQRQEKTPSNYQEAQKFARKLIADGNRTLKKSGFGNHTVWDLVETPKAIQSHIITKSQQAIKPTLKEQGFNALFSGSQSVREYERQRRIQYGDPNATTRDRSHISQLSSYTYKEGDFILKMNEAAEKYLKINYTQLAKDVGLANRNKELPGNCGQVSYYFTKYGDKNDLQNVIAQNYSRVED